MLERVSDCYKSQKGISTLCFSLFSGWLLSFPFQGQVLVALLPNAGVNLVLMNFGAVFAHFLGLVTSGFFIKTQNSAKRIILLSTIVCVCGSMIFFLPFTFLWYISLSTMAFFAGLVVASWGFYFRNYTLPEQRIKTAANLLIVSNVLMILTNSIAVTFSGFIGLVFSILLLIAAFFLGTRLENTPEENSNSRLTLISIVPTSVSKAMMVLGIFILIITINSGLMYQVVSPAFSQYKWLTSYYWAIPYIATLLIVRNLSEKINKSYLLYVAMIMIGLSYTLFMWLDKSRVSYIVIDTLMLGAFGVCDLFWWSILGCILDYSKNPARIFGVGLSMNVLGIIFGGIIGSTIFSSEKAFEYVAIIALIVIFVVLSMLPLLNSQLEKLLKKHPFVLQLSKSVTNESLEKEYEKKEQYEKDPMNKEHAVTEPGRRGPEEVIQILKIDKQLTDKETEVVRLLLRGYTYKAISESLYISENTLKYHIKNIYQKFCIKSRMELIEIFNTVPRHKG